MQTSGLLQRNCACGGSSSGGVYQECNTEASSVNTLSERSSSESYRPGFAHNFADVRVTAGTQASPLESVNLFHDEDTIHQPLIDDFRRREGLPQGGIDKSGNPIGPSDAQIKYQGLALTCPTSTEVESSVDLTAQALAAGYRTGYGIMVKMRVRPDARTWDGTKIAESLTQLPGTCPASLTKSPCEGGPPFTVGAPTKGFSLLPVQQGLINRFYDFHRTRSDISLLHDQTRNPSGLNSCQSICKQEYSCEGTVIGQHTITRTFRKGTYGGKDVTIIDVTKT
jgi:hypothetical protein